MIEFSDDIKKFLADNYPGRDIYSMSKEELIEFREEITENRQNYFLIEMADKRLGNAAYGASANHTFYFYDMHVASDITAECRALTRFMWDRLEKFMREDIWERKDLWEMFDFELDNTPANRAYMNSHPISVYSDTDSVYITYEPLFKCMTKESQAKYDTDDKICKWILDFNKRFLNDQNTAWLDEMYNPRHGHNIHQFELEAINMAQIVLKKKKYVKAVAFNKGVFYDNYKVSGTGVELIKSTTPALCKVILKDLIHMLLFEDIDDKDAYMVYFNDKLSEYKKQFYTAEPETISESVGIGDYKKYVLNDTDEFRLASGTPLSVHAIARFNYLAHKHGQDSIKMISGKIKYYNIRTGYKKDQTGFFGYPSGQLPDWAPPIDLQTQWCKTVVTPINRFLEVLQIPQADPTGVIQPTLF